LPPPSSKAPTNAAPPHCRSAPLPLQRPRLTAPAQQQEHPAAREDKPASGHEKRRQSFQRNSHAEECGTPNNVGGEQGQTNPGPALALFLLA